jgi:2-phosphosulfolactate phosphatase
MVDVAFTGAEARPAGITVVIDVLRATSTIVQALDAGYRRVLCVDTLDRARALAAPGRVLAGERRCVRPAGFELGNSPAETIPPRGTELVLATTNGAPAILRAAELSPIVLVACLLNLAAVVEAAAGDDVQLLCSGTDGRPALEDVYVAGRIARRLGGRQSDSALVARAVARTYSQGREALAAGANARVLVAAGLATDIDWCARESITRIVPRLRRLTSGIATLDPGTHRQRSKSSTPFLVRRF